MKLLYKYICASVLLLIVSTGHLFADPISEGQQAYLQGNYAEAIRLVSPLAEKGDILAQYNLGVMYANEKSEIHDNKEAAKWFLLAAEQGDTDAQVWLGESYIGGRGVTWDVQKAVDWYRLAGEQGHIVAQVRLGLMYDEGQGVTQDHQEAVKWYQLCLLYTSPSPRD